MVTLGSDSHKRSHTLLAVDGNGCPLEERKVPATPAGHMEALAWARRWPERRWALENCRHLSRLLERDLLTAGEAVVQVSPKLMGKARRSGRELGKSDPIDALAVARAALRESAPSGGFIGAWIRPNSGVSADQSFIPSERRQGHGDTRQRQPQAEPHGVSSGRERMPA